MLPMTLAKLEWILWHFFNKSWGSKQSFDLHIVHLLDRELADGRSGDGVVRGREDAVHELSTDDVTGGLNLVEVEGMRPGHRTVESTLKKSGPEMKKRKLNKTNFKVGSVFTSCCRWKTECWKHDCFGLGWGSTNIGDPSKSHQIGSGVL